MKRNPTKHIHWPGKNRCQKGVSLIASLILLIVIALFGISAAHLAIEEEKATRSEGDRQIAFQAAEAALVDAELDIENSPDAAKSRSHIFSKNSALGFPDEGEPGCRSGDGNIYLGLCRHSSEAAKPVWLSADFADDGSSNSNSVSYGTFTGNALQVGKGTLPSKLPRYIIEKLPFNQPGKSADHTSYFYRVTAIGFGARDTTKVVLQTFYRKEKQEGL